MLYFLSEDLHFCYYSFDLLFFYYHIIDSPLGDNQVIVLTHPEQKLQRFIFDTSSLTKGDYLQIIDSFFVVLNYRGFCIVHLRLPLKFNLLFVFQIFIL